MEVHFNWLAIFTMPWAAMIVEGVIDAKLYQNVLET